MTKNIVNSTNINNLKDRSKTNNNSSKIKTTKRSKQSTKQNELIKKVDNNNSNNQPLQLQYATTLKEGSGMDPEMIEMYKLLDKFDTTKLEKFNTVLTMYRQKPQMVNTITFKVNQDVNLDIEYYNATSPQHLDTLFASDDVVLTTGTGSQQSQSQEQGQVLENQSTMSTTTGSGLKPIERYRFILEYKDYNSRSELDRITKSYGARKFRNYVGNQIMEQFHRPLLGKLLNQFEELKQRIKYDPEEINIGFENFNFIGSNYIMMAILKYFVQSGTMEMNRDNGYDAHIEATRTENPTFKITFSRPKSIFSRSEPTSE